MLSLDNLLIRFNSLPDNKKMELVKTALDESSISYVEEVGEVGLESLFPDFEGRFDDLPIGFTPADVQTQKAEETESLQSYVGETNNVYGLSLAHVFVDRSEIKRSTIEVDESNSLNRDTYITEKTSLLAA